MLIRTLCTPDNTGRRTRSVESSVGFVTFMGGTEVTMGFGLQFYSETIPREDSKLAMQSGCVLLLIFIKKKESFL